VANAQSFADEESLRRQIQQWVQQLGSESFLARQRAESLLIRAGIRAYPELQRVKQGSDIEVVRRAEYILSQIEQAFLDLENREVASWIQSYMVTPNPAYKARIIWVFADPTSDLANGEGLQTLCRLVQFEENPSLRLEAAKSLIASPPFSPALRQTWYRRMRNNVHDLGGDELLRCLARYAQLWCDLDETDDKTTPEFQERVLQVGTETLQLLNRPENSIQIGSKIDVLLHYAVAELQDAVGLTDERDQTISKALAIKPEPIQTSEPIEPILSVVEDNLLMGEHFYVGWCLKRRYRLHWAMAHFQKVMETGEISLRAEASEMAAAIALYLADYSSAMVFYDKHIEILKSPDYTAKKDDSLKRVIQTQKRKAYCLAEQAAAEQDWEKVQKLITEGWTISETPDNITDVDLAILAYRLCKQKDDVDLAFRNTMNVRFKQIWQTIENDYRHSTPDQRPAKMIIMCNAAAWMLANTDGDYPSALTLVETALKAEPDDAGILDTLAHVYFLGGKVDEAIRTQEQVVRIAPEAVIFQQALERFKQVK